MSPTRPHPRRWARTTGVSALGALIMLTGPLSSPTSAHAAPQEGHAPSPGAAAAARAAVAPELVDELAAGRSVKALVSLRTPHLAQPSVKKLKATATASKANLAHQHAGKFALLEDYAAVPVMLVRLDSAAALEELGDDPNVASVQPDSIVEPALAESLPLIDQPEAWAAGGTGAGTSVAVLDTGVDYTNAAFGSCAQPGPSCTVAYAADIAANDGKRDADGHGTNVAGIVHGVAPSAKILALDVFGRGGAATSDLVKAVNWVVEHAEDYNIRAVNLSIGNGDHFRTECSESPLTQPFAALAVAGVVPVVSSGNSGYVDGVYQSGVSHPACVPGAVRVGAVYDANVGAFEVNKKTGDFWFQKKLQCRDATTRADQITCFSQGGPLLSILAPGSKITAAGITQSGTSQAAPHVAGAIAVLASKYPAATAGQAAASLASSDVLLTDPREGSASGYVFVPRLNVAMALEDLGRRMKPQGGLLAGDADNFGYGDGASVPCAFYDLSGPEDLGVFDRELTDLFEVDRWTQDFTSALPDGFRTARVTVTIPMIFDDGASSTLEIDGHTFTATPDAFSFCGPQVERTFTLTGEDASVADDGQLSFVFQENGDDVALDYSRVVLTGVDGRVIG